MKVEPLRELKDIKSIKRILSNHPRNFLLFVIGINSGLRTGDLLSLRIKDVKGLKVGQSVTITEKKTGKTNGLLLNKEIKEALDAYLKSENHMDHHYLFKSRKGSNYPLTTFAVTRYVKQWAESINLKGSYGAHTLRKTWCYHQRKTFGVSWELIALRCNHSSPSITRAYLGILPEEVNDILNHNI